MIIDGIRIEGLNLVPESAEAAHKLLVLAHNGIQRGEVTTDGLFAAYVVENNLGGPQQLMVYTAVFLPRVALSAALYYSQYAALADHFLRSLPSSSNS